MTPFMGRLHTSNDERPVTLYAGDGHKAPPSL